MKRYLLAALFSSILLMNKNSAQGYAKDPDSLIFTAMGLISQDSMRANIQYLQDMGTRFMIAPNRKEVATWIMNKYLEMGIPEVRLDSFQSTVDVNYPPIIYDTTTWQYNVEARIEGSIYPDQEVVLIGHYDDATQDFDPMILAPGADDNGSGTAATLEIARVITEMGYQPEQTIIFLTSAAEELLYYGDAGTEHYAMEAFEAGRNIVMAINNDMIGWDDGSWSISLFNHIYSIEVTALVIDIINNYTTLGIDSWQPSHEVGGDVQPFLNVGYQGIYLMEHYINPNYHSIYDLIDSLNFAYLEETTRVSLGSILHYDMTVGLKGNEKEVCQLSVYPNPATDVIKIRMPVGTASGELAIIDIQGKELIRSHINRDNPQVDVSGIPPGLYMVLLKTGIQTMQSRLVISVD